MHQPNAQEKEHERFRSLRSSFLFVTLSLTHRQYSDDSYESSRAALLVRYFRESRRTNQSEMSQVTELIISFFFLPISRAKQG